MFAMLADENMYNDKIDMFIACAPIVYLNNNQIDVLRRASDEWKSILLATKLLKIYDINDQALTGFKVFCT